jgi:hypothetical protein
LAAKDWLTDFLFRAKAFSALGQTSSRAGWSGLLLALDIAWLIKVAVQVVLINVADYIVGNSVNGALASCPPHSSEQQRGGGLYK